MRRDDAEPTAEKAELLAAFRGFDEAALRDLWLFDQEGLEALYVRSDVAEKLERVDVERYIDNERYGYVTGETYRLLYYADYRYTVRGFTEFEQFRMFFPEGDDRVGLLASFDRRDGGYDFGELREAVTSVVADRPSGSFAPDGDARSDAA